MPRRLAIEKFGPPALGVRMVPWRKEVRFVLDREEIGNLLTSKWVEVSEPAQLARCLQPICHRVTTID